MVDESNKIYDISILIEDEWCMVHHESTIYRYVYI